MLFIQQTFVGTKVNLPKINKSIVESIETNEGGYNDMSDITSRPVQARTIVKDLNERIEGLTAWLRETGLEGSAQAELDDEMTERLCWHYGYLIALRDVRELLAAA